MGMVVHTINLPLDFNGAALEKMTNVKKCVLICTLFHLMASSIYLSDCSFRQVRKLV